MNMSAVYGELCPDCAGCGCRFCGGLGVIIQEVPDPPDPPDPLDFYDDAETGKPANLDAAKEEK